MVEKHNDAIKVYGWMGDFTGSGVYRISLPFGQLYQHHPNFLVKANTVIEDWDARTADIIVCQRSCTNDQLELITKWSKHYKCKIVYEVDDDILNIDSSNKACEFYSDPKIRNNICKMLELSDLVTVSTLKLKQNLQQYNDNITILPNYIDEKLLAFDSNPPDINKTIIGWGGSITHQIDFAVCASPLRRVMDMQKETWLHLYGTYYNPGLTERLYFTPWSDDMEAFHRSLRLHIGLAPLRTCTFNESKSYIKMLEYAALGIPAVASNVTAYQDFVKHTVTGYLVNNNAEWRDRILNLVRNPELRTYIGNNAREYAKDFTIQKNYLKWAKVYQELVNE